MEAVTVGCSREKGTPKIHIIWDLQLLFPVRCIWSIRVALWNVATSPFNQERLFAGRLRGH